ncbi:MAG TPA: glycine cleavage system protein GcvH [Acidimicrobiia bacterium]|nr:glycine cleavage system protein GcvH [Acidimicrobiia bacterium]
MNVPSDRRYTDQHEWGLLEDDGLVRIGITDYAQDALGDVVFVDLPAEGNHVEAGTTVAEVESTKSLAEVYAPMAGTVARVNSALPSAPELINEDPYDRGWFIAIQPDDPSDFEGMLDAEAYKALIA